MPCTVLFLTFAVSATTVISIIFIMSVSFGWIVNSKMSHVLLVSLLIDSVWSLLICDPNVVLIIMLHYYKFCQIFLKKYWVQSVLANYYCLPSLKIQGIHISWKKSVLIFGNLWMPMTTFLTLPELVLSWHSSCALFADIQLFPAKLGI